MIRQLAHLNIVTNDLSKIIDFYSNKLGMKVKFTLDNDKDNRSAVTSNAATPPFLNSSTRKWLLKFGAAKWRS
jgi:catechol 2,3-dioxygenase-like lactoylglutathione lyase family enzyme